MKGNYQTCEKCGVTRNLDLAESCAVCVDIQWRAEMVKRDEPRATPNYWRKCPGCGEQISKSHMMCKTCLKRDQKREKKRLYDEAKRLKLKKTA